MPPKLIPSINEKIIATEAVSKPGVFNNKSTIGIKITVIGALSI